MQGQLSGMRSLGHGRSSISASSSHSRAWAVVPRHTPGRACRTLAARTVCTSRVEEVERVLPMLKETEKEKSRVYRRTVFTHEQWVVHRSTGRYFRHMSGLFDSRIVRGLAKPIGIVVAIAGFVTIYETSREAGYLPPYLPQLSAKSAEPFTLTSFALSLLLVFRTNASYSRWDEARKLWGGVTNRTRDIVRQGLTWISPQKPAHRQMLSRWVTAFPLSLKCHLTFNSDLAPELEGLLEPEEIKALLASQHRPNYVQRVISETIKDAELTDMEVFLMDGNLTFFADACGACERILGTPIPLSWTRHTSRFLVIWLATLPFQLYSVAHLATVPVAAVISGLLLGIEEIGVQIEEPFSILPLDAMCAKMGTNIKEMSVQAEDCHELMLLESAEGGVPTPTGYSTRNSSQNRATASSLG